MIENLSGKDSPGSTAGASRSKIDDFVKRRERSFRELVAVHDLARSSLIQPKLCGGDLLGHAANENERLDLRR